MNYIEEPPVLGKKVDEEKLLRKPGIEEKEANFADGEEVAEKNQTPEVEPGEIAAEQGRLVENLQTLEINTAKVEKTDSNEHTLPLQILVAKIKNAGGELFNTFNYLAKNEKCRELMQKVFLPSLLVGLEAGGIDISKFQNGSAESSEFLPEEVKAHLEKAGDFRTKAGIMLRNRPEAQSFSPKNLFDQFRGDGSKPGLDWEGGKRSVASKGTNGLLGAGANLLGYSLGRVVKKRFSKK